MIDASIKDLSNYVDVHTALTTFTICTIYYSATGDVVKFFIKIHYKKFQNQIIQCHSIQLIMVIGARDFLGIIFQSLARVLHSSAFIILLGQRARLDRTVGSHDHPLDD